jgi:hypothetical protein
VEREREERCMASLVVKSNEGLMEIPCLFISEIFGNDKKRRKRKKRKKTKQETV